MWRRNQEPANHQTCELDTRQSETFRWHEYKQSRKLWAHIFTVVDNAFNWPTYLAYTNKKNSTQKNKFSNEKNFQTRLKEPIFYSRKKSIKKVILTAKNFLYLSEKFKFSKWKTFLIITGKNNFPNKEFIIFVWKTNFLY